MLVHVVLWLHNHPCPVFCSPWSGEGPTWVCIRTEAGHGGIFSLFLCEMSSGSSNLIKDLWGKEKLLQCSRNWRLWRNLDVLLELLSCSWTLSAFTHWRFFNLNTLKCWQGDAEKLFGVLELAAKPRNTQWIIKCLNALNNPSAKEQVLSWYLQIWIRNLVQC